MHRFATVDKHQTCMTQPISDVEIAILNVRRADARVAQQRERIAFLKARGRPTKAAEGLLRRLVESLELAREHLLRVSRALPGYQCHVMDGDQIQAVHSFECANDAEAILKITILLDSKPAHLAAEIWHGNLQVARIPSRNRANRN